MIEMSVTELKRRIDAGEALVLLDVREPHELETASLPFATPIPMGQIAERLDELPRDRTIAVLCHGGVRSARVAHFLVQNGYDKTINVAGGIDAWSREVDPTVPLY